MPDPLPSFLSAPPWQLEIIDEMPLTRKVIKSRLRAVLTSRSVPIRAD